MDTKIFNLRELSPAHYRTTDSEGNERPSKSMGELVQDKLDEHPNYKVESLTYTSNNSMHTETATLVLARRDILKTGADLQDKITYYNVLLKKKEDEYSGLSQIDMQSQTGNQIMERINHLNGALEALKWVME